MKKHVRWNQEKSNHIRQLRGFGFEEIESILNNVGPVFDGVNPSSNHPHQRLYVVELNGYPVCVPYVENEHEIFLKTAFPNRKLKNR